MSTEDDVTSAFPPYWLSWLAFDQLARGEGGADVVRQLREAQRSRRLGFISVLMDDLATYPDHYEPLPTPDEAWELLVRVAEEAPPTLDLILTHPYTGTWISHVRRLIHNRANSDRPLWTHVGYLHSLAAAAAIRAGIDFEIPVSVVDGGVMLPTLGMARLAPGEPWSVAVVRGRGGRVEVRTESELVRLPDRHPRDAENWRSLREVCTEADGCRLSIRLDDLDPYRGLDEPLPPRPIDPTELAAWTELLRDAWRLIVQCLPVIADGLPEGLYSLVPYPPVPVRNQSASVSEAFGSATIERPLDAPALAATLVHEFAHIRLNGLLHLTELHKDDRTQRFYTLWRDDPRHVPGALQGVFAFFGVTAFWRALAKTETGDRRAAFEFAYWRAGTWRTLQALRDDPNLTEAGHRFVAGIAERLGPWQAEPVPDDVAELVMAACTDHHAGWRLRHVRPPEDIVKFLTDSWLSGHKPGGDTRAFDEVPVVEPDGDWPGARTDLVRRGLTEPGPGALADLWPTLPGAIAADFAYAAGDYAEAERLYRKELAADPDSATSWVGLGLALSARGNHTAAGALLDRPELVRAVHREIRARAATVPAPDELAAWLADTEETNSPRRRRTRVATPVPR